VALVVAAAKLALAAAAPCLAPRVAGAGLIRRAPHLVRITPWAMLLQHMEPDEAAAADRKQQEIAGTQGKHARVSSQRTLINELKVADGTKCGIDRGGRRMNYLPRRRERRARRERPAAAPNERAVIL